MNPIEIYTRPQCPYCTHAKALLKSRSIPYDEIGTLDPDRLNEMLDRTNGRTLPQILVNEQPIGGFTELRELDESGQLFALLNSETNNLN